MHALLRGQQLERENRELRQANDILRVFKFVAGRALSVRLLVCADTLANDAASSKAIATLTRRLPVGGGGNEEGWLRKGGQEEK